MNRIEYMTRLAQLLQDVPEEERREAMKYYNDYFDEAGEENEEKVASELGSPEKVAATIKADLYGNSNAAGEYAQTEYQDTQVAFGNLQDEKKKNNWLKILLIIFIAAAVISIVGPIAIAVIAVVVAVVFSGFILLIGCAITTICIMITGFALFIAGLTQVAAAIEVALALTGAGLIIFVLGMVGTVLLIKLCIFLFPVMFRGIANMCKKMFQGKKVTV